MFAVLSAYYSVVADAAAAAGGRVIKVMGDSALLTFPLDRARVAVQSLHELQERATTLWRKFDDRCHVQVKVSLGSVMCGMLGAPGDERLDIVGDSLNSLFKAPWRDFDLHPDVVALLN